jgi:DNA-directed RNA polymerase specialized sigma24 family protein
MPPPAGKRAPDPAESEASLLARAQAGDVNAFKHLSGAYADRLFMLLLRLLGDRSEAEDVAQEVMLRAWQGIARFQGQSSYFTWLYRIAVNEASRALEKKARQPAAASIGAYVAAEGLGAHQRQERVVEQLHGPQHTGNEDGGGGLQQEEGLPTVHEGVLRFAPWRPW